MGNPSERNQTVGGNPEQVLNSSVEALGASESKPSLGFTVPGPRKGVEWREAMVGEGEAGKLLNTFSSMCLAFRNCCGFPGHDNTEDVRS